MLDHQRTTWIKGQKWPPLKLVYVFIFCSLPHIDYKKRLKHVMAVQFEKYSRSKVNAF